MSYISMPDHVSRCKDVLDLTERQLVIVVALLAAEHWERGPCSVRDIARCTRLSAQSELYRLARGLWVEEAGFRRVDRCHKEKVWRATARARVRLGFQRWEPVTDEALAELIQAGKLEVPPVAGEERAAS